MKKTVFISNIVRAVFIFMLLIFVFAKNEQFSIRIIIVSFLLLTACYLAENLCNFFQRPTGAKIFHKLFVIIFLLFGFGFLIVWSYAWVKEKQYVPLLFTIPFWILEIHIFRKSILCIKSKPGQTGKQSKFNFGMVVSCFLVFCVLLSGVICIVIGIRDTYLTNKKTKNYLTTTGYFKEYEIYDSDKEREHGKSEAHTTYRFLYVYEVDGKEYTIKTDYGSGSIPDINSSRTIKYNPIHPSEAVFMGTNRNSGLIYFGAFFLLGGMVFVLAFLYVRGVFDKVKINVMGLYAGIVIFAIGIGIIAFQMGEASSFMEAAKRMGLWLFIPVLFIAVGGFQIVKCLFFL